MPSSSSSCLFLSILLVATLLPICKAFFSHLPLHQKKLYRPPTITMSSSSSSSSSPLELWLDARPDMEATGASAPQGATTCLYAVSIPSTVANAMATIIQQDMATGRLYDNKRFVGVAFDVKSAQDVSKAIAAVGSVDWVVISSFNDWSLIPIENIIAAASQTPTRICVAVKEIDMVQGAAFALHTGVDALLLPPENDALWQAAREAQARKADMIGAGASGNTQGVSTSAAAAVADEEIAGFVRLVEAKVTEVSAGGVGDRVCLDLIQMLKEGEGCLVGSSAKGLALVQAEVRPTSYINSRPFRVNAGPVHSYVLMEDGSAKYLSEVEAGDSVLVVNAQGKARGVNVGRCKVERRPVLKVAYTWGEGEEGKESTRTAQVFLQQAETVRLIGPVSGSGENVSVAITEVQPGDTVLIRSREQGTHLGRTITAAVEEK